MTNEEKYYTLAHDPRLKGYFLQQDAALGLYRDPMKYVAMLRPKTLIDVGCGANQFVQRVRREFPDVTAIGVDIAHPDADLKRNMTWLEGIENDSFALTTSFDALEHLANEAEAIAALSEMKRVGVHRGWFVIYAESKDESRVMDGESLHPLCRCQTWWRDTIEHVGGVIMDRCIRGDRFIVGQWNKGEEGWSSHLPSEWTLPARAGVLQAA